MYLELGVLWRWGPLNRCRLCLTDSRKTETIGTSPTGAPLLVTTNHEWRRSNAGHSIGRPPDSPISELADLLAGLLPLKEVGCLVTVQQTPKSSTLMDLKVDNLLFAIVCVIRRAVINSPSPVHLGCNLASCVPRAPPALSGLTSIIHAPVSAVTHSYGRNSNSASLLICGKRLQRFSTEPSAFTTNDSYTFCDWMTGENCSPASAFATIGRCNDDNARISSTLMSASRRCARAQCERDGPPVYRRANLPLRPVTGNSPSRTAARESDRASPQRHLSPRHGDLNNRPIGRINGPRRLSPLVRRP
ncbi:unnamed protein product, partial [Iphiclides podalirius]